MRRIIPLLVTVLFAAACGGGGETTDPASLTSCDAVAGAAIAVIQDSIDLMDEASTNQSEPDAGIVAAIEEAGAALDERAAALRCTDAEMTALLAELADGLEAESVVGQLIIERFKVGDEGFFSEG